MTDQDCYRPPAYEKLDRWPEFESDMFAHYRLAVDRTLTEPVRWASTPNAPSSYRIYELNGAGQ